MPSPIVSLPIGLSLVSLGADVMYRSGRGPAWWDDVAFFSMFAGLVAAVLLVVPSLVDEVVAGARVRLTQAGRLEPHLAAVVALYVVNLCLRAYAQSAILPVVMSLAGIALLAVAAAVGDGGAAHAQVDRAARPCPREVLIETPRAVRSA